MLRINTPVVVHDFIADEVIIVHLEHGYYFSLANLSASVWRAIDKNFSIDDILLIVETLYGPTDVFSFIKELEAEELVISDEEIPRNLDLEQLKDLLSGGEDVLLKLNRYTDMQDFLLLDPIHDVGEAGWPHKD